DPRDRDAAHPFVEVGQDRAVLDDAGELAEELLHRESESDDLVHLAVGGVDGDAVVFPEQVLIRVEGRVAGAVIEEDDPRPAGNEPAAEITWETIFLELLERLADRPVGGLLLELDRRRLRVVRPDQAVPVTPL